MARGIKTRPPDMRACRATMEHIRLLCRSGAGLQAMVGPLCAAVRDLIGASGVACFWLDMGDGLPAGFFHDSAPAEIKDLFISRLEELFIDPEEITSVSLIKGDGPLIGKMLRPGEQERFLKGKIYEFLCAPLNHHHMLDMALRRNGEGAAVFCAWNPSERPFTQADANLLEPVQRLIEIAIAADERAVVWRPTKEGSGHFITDLSGERLLAIHPDAESALMASHLLRQKVSMVREATVAPSFAAELAKGLAHDRVATMHLPVANGRITARASKTRVVNRGEIDALMHVDLIMEKAANVLAVEYVMGLQLTPLQREIALFSITGGARADCFAKFGVSEEALKKHLKPIFEATGTARWPELNGLPDYA